MKQEQQITILQQIFPFLTTIDIIELFTISQYYALKNKTKIIERGQNAQKIFFILKGMVRGFYINEKGEEKNVFLRPEHTITGAPDSLFSNAQTKYTFETILETHVLILPFESFVHLTTKHPNILKLYIAGLQENIQILVFRVESLIDKLPEERYEELLEKSPQFFQTAFHKHIANYLGITPVSLSRIIKRRKNNKTTFKKSPY